MVNADQLARIPYLNSGAISGRFLPTLCFYEAGWRLWIEAGEHAEQLIELKPVEAAEMLYFAKSPARETDVSWFFLDFLCQRASTPEVGKAFSALRDDINNLSASLAKISLLSSSKDRVPEGLSRMAVTEVEYLLIVCRGIFDFLQEFMRGVWNTVILADDSIIKRDLKKTFSEMIVFNKVASTSEQLSERFGLPPQIAERYVRAAEIFMDIRRFRDNVVHHGSPIQTIYETDLGFFIGSSFRPLAKLEVWDENERIENDLVPLLPALQMLVSHTLFTCDDFAQSLLETIQFPEPLVPEMSLYVRSYFTDHLSAAITSSRARLKKL